MLWYNFNESLIADNFACFFRSFTHKNLPLLQFNASLSDLNLPLFQLNPSLHNLKHSFLGFYPPFHEANFSLLGANVSFPETEGSFHKQTGSFCFTKPLKTEQDQVLKTAKTPVQINTINPEGTKRL
ncbi:MAG: hypothetical protein U0W24_08395 [Bacteroidales bacterium]